MSIAPEPALVAVPSRKFPFGAGDPGSSSHGRLRRSTCQEFGVLSVPPRPAPWPAAQIAALQRLSANRLLLGVGIGGFPDYALWRALSVPAEGRGRATDETLALLPQLAAGEEVRFEEADTTLGLAPAAPVPPVLVGGHLILGEGPSARNACDVLVRQLSEEHEVPEEEAARAPMLARTPEDPAELCSAYTEAGAERVIAGAGHLGWEEQLDFIGEARALLPG